MFLCAAKIRSDCRQTIFTSNVVLHWHASFCAYKCVWAVFCCFYHASEAIASTIQRRRSWGVVGCQSARSLTFHDVSNSSKADESSGPSFPVNFFFLKKVIQCYFLQCLRLLGGVYKQWYQYKRLVKMCTEPPLLVCTTILSTPLSVTILNWE